MSLITRCPACSTMFKVAQEQLRVSDGWVRCGQCDEVFDANVHLQPAVPPAPPAAPSRALSPSTNSAPTLPEYDWSDVAGMESPSVPAAPPAATRPAALQVPAAAPVPAQAVAKPVAAAPAAMADTSTAAAVQAKDPFLDQSPQALSQPLDADPALPEFTREVADALFTPTPARPAPSFMAYGQAQRTREASIRAWMWPVGAVLALALVGQVLWNERDRIASASPALAPVLRSACAVLGCRIEALRRVDALVIESSSFSKALSQVYTLQFTVRNTGSVPVAMPAVELTLTDLQDRVLLRRVLQAKEFAGPKAALPVGGSVAANVPVQVRPMVGAESIAGYRLLAFYP